MNLKKVRPFVEKKKKLEFEKGKKEEKKKKGKKRCNLSHITIGGALVIVASLNATYHT